ncbi:DoxX family protein [Flavobacterium sp.]|uniref:DoxX family protein n=1 Tax=Flavobacterium sp. TaxID=239 RepID=UPI003D6B2687
MKSFPFLSTPKWLSILQIALSLFMMAHGSIRIYAGTVDGFGSFLNENGFFIGRILAWGITFFEIAGGILLLLNQFRKIICFIFILQLLTGIILVHAANGWFVVGYSTGGMEYSVLLILCFFLVASNQNQKAVI